MSDHRFAGLGSAHDVVASSALLGSLDLRKPRLHALKVPFSYCLALLRGGTRVVFLELFRVLAPLWKTSLIAFGHSSSLRRISGTGLKGVMPSRPDNSNPTPNYSLLIMILQHRHQLRSGRVRSSSMEMKKRLARKAKLFCYQNKWLHRYREYQKYSQR